MTLFVPLSGSGVQNRTTKRLRGIATKHGKIEVPELPSFR